jgi:hypothetical protein
MKPLWKALAVVGAVVTVGSTVFLVSRPAAAAAAGKKAFKVSPDCLTVEIVDEEAGRAALTAAATISFRSMSERADLLLLRVLSYALNPCVPTDDMKITGIPGVPIGVTVGEIKAIIGNRTVEEVGELAAQGGLALPGLEGAGERNPVNAILAWTTGGDY